ncbi:hypothetical protein BGX33_010489 [Mortierella sp. NVP41]|nr:hypothetical protein BGX33_010489 [Mortierella sp. NVP41]
MNAGLYASVLARTPSKLVKMLLAQEGITQAMIDAQLTIIQGEVADVSAVKRVLLVPTRKQDTSTAGEEEAEEEVEVVSQIISRIGGVAQLHWSLTQSVTIEGLEVYVGIRPLITVISSTGISDGPEDVPLGLRYLYHVVLAAPHKDKKEMERIVTENSVTAAVATAASSKTTATAMAATTEGVFDGSIIIRASLLMGD